MRSRLQTRLRNCAVSISCALVLTMASSAFAGAPAAWYTSVTIAYVYSGMLGARSAVGITTPISNGTCPITKEFSIDESSQRGWTMWSLIMLAYSKNITISIYTDGSCSSNGVNATDVYIGGMQ